MQLLFLGIFIGFILDRYVFVCFDMFLDVLQQKLTQAATASQLVSQSMAYEFARLYPESLKQQQEICQTNAVGFDLSSNYEDYYDENNEYEI